MRKNAITYYKLFKAYFKGFIFGLFCFNFKPKLLRVGVNFNYNGILKLGNFVKIADNVRIYNHCVIGNRVVIGDNVELRCNGRPNKVIIGDNTTVNRNTVIGGMVSIGENCMIAPNCVIMGSNHTFSDTSIDIKRQSINSKGITICDNVWIGANATILDGVVIGSGCVIGGGAVVTKSIDSMSVAVGNPAKIIKKRT